MLLQLFVNAVAQFYDTADIFVKLLFAIWNKRRKSIETQLKMGFAMYWLQWLMQGENVYFFLFCFVLRCYGAKICFILIHINST